MLDSQIFCCILSIERGEVNLLDQVGQSSRFELEAAQLRSDPQMKT